MLEILLLAYMEEGVILSHVLNDRLVCLLALRVDGVLRSSCRDDERKDVVNRLGNTL